MSPSINRINRVPQIALNTLLLILLVRLTSFLTVHHEYSDLFILMDYVAGVCIDLEARATDCPICGSLMDLNDHELRYTQLKRLVLSPEQSGVFDASEAKYKLGLMYTNGHGVKQNSVLACQWLTYAAADGTCIIAASLVLVRRRTVPCSDVWGLRLLLCCVFFLRIMTLTHGAFGTLIFRPRGSQILSGKHIQRNVERRKRCVECHGTVYSLVHRCLFGRPSRRAVQPRV